MYGFTHEIFNIILGVLIPYSANTIRKILYSLLSISGESKKIIFTLG